MKVLARLAAVMVRPRATLRAVLAEPADRMVLPLFTLAVISGIFGDLDAPAMRQVINHEQGWTVGLMVAGAALALMAVLVAFAWFYAWVPLLIGRFLEGNGEIRGMRSALAWGSAPVIWALLYRVPGAFLMGGSTETQIDVSRNRVQFDPGILAEGCGVALVFAMLELIVFAWCLTLLSNTVAEVHGFSVWRGLGTLLLSMLVPVIVVIAAVLSM